jgi:hypothetical protein
VLSALFPSPAASAFSAIRVYPATARIRTPKSTDRKEDLWTKKEAGCLGTLICMAAMQVDRQNMFAFLCQLRTPPGSRSLIRSNSAISLSGARFTLGDCLTNRFAQAVVIRASICFASWLASLAISRHHSSVILRNCESFTPLGSRDRHQLAGTFGSRRRR